MLELKEFIRLLPGSSFATEVKTTGGQRCILKMRGSGNGTVSLVSEFIVNRTGALLGWPVPDVKLLRIPTGFPWEFGTDEFDDILTKSFGTNLAIDLIADARPAVNLNETGALLKARCLALDLFFCNYDRTAASRNILVDAADKHWLIDHGNCLFLKKKLAAEKIQLGPNHILENYPMDGLYIQALSELIALDSNAIVDECPEEWLLETGVDRKRLHERLAHRRALCSRIILKNTQAV